MANDILTPQMLQDAVNELMNPRILDYSPSPVMASPEMVHGHDEHMKFKTKNHSWLCWYECHNQTEFLELAHAEFDKATAYAKEKCGDVWDNIPAEEQILIAMLAAEEI